MKKIIRISCLVLCVITLGVGFVGCGAKDATAGPQINMYLSSEVYNFDPAYAHTDVSANKLLGLMYEGLFTLDGDGDVKHGMCESWIYTEDEGVDKESDEDNIYKMEFTLKKSAWSDGIAVQADHFVYAWKRLLDPDFDGEGAELLFDIVGAYERKNNGASPDDVGLIADQDILTVLFNHPIDPHEFERRLTSLALVPLRQNGCVEYYHNWSTSNTTIKTNGAYTILSYYPGTGMELGRNIYYNHNASKDNDKAPNSYKYIKPYKIIIDFSLNAEEMMQKYEDGKLFYIGELPASKEIREKYLDKVKLTDTLSTHTYFFNTTVAPFNNAAVRKALSDVISRADIANEVVYAYPATGIVPNGIKDLTKKDSFAQNNENKLSADAISVTEAVNAIRNSGVDLSAVQGKTFYLTVRVNTDSKMVEDELEIKDIDKSNKKIYDTVDYVVADMVVKKWNQVASQLGFNFDIKCVNTAQYKETTSSLVQYRDYFIEALYGTLQGSWKDKGLGYEVDPKNNVYVKTERASFDIIALDSSMIDTTAFSALSVFAAEYSGAMSDDEFNTLGHITGYNNEAYNKLISEAYQAKVDGNIQLMSEKLHEAETMLLKDMPVMPLFVYKNAVLKSRKLLGVKYSEWGYPIFDKANLPKWEKYLPKTDEEED